ncbi:SbtR family transcriptional regulator [Nocardia abscessus]|uniref:SbtR family transcriptional regulator n=1 Tax=Nocardia abscessus TaxID=120957 RepID=UPI0006880E08|nr:hypothetical protein [Nocardia abscessus]MCC3326457.1 hypothetical protein [Nocardia abscessus]
MITTTFQQLLDDEIAPVLMVAQRRASAAEGLMLVFEHLLSLLANERGRLDSSQRLGSVEDVSTSELLTALGHLLERAQGQGAIRADLEADDLPALLVMLVGALQFTESGDGWPRYLVLMADAMKPGEHAAPLPGAASHGNHAKLPPPLKIP